MKRRKMILAAGIMALALAGCGQGSSSETAPMEEIQEIESTETTEEETQQTESAEETAEEQQEEGADKTEEEKEDKKAEAAPEAVKEKSADSSGNSAQEGYADNFSVDSAASAEFGKKVKEAVANEDLDALAELAAYPLYVGFPEGGKTVASSDEFTAIGAEKIFTQDLKDSVASADETSLSPSMAGFVLSEENGAANIVFGVRDGKLAVSGINY